ncbi:epoxyqueuosine reductase [Chloroflexota bacterium]|nr:epoxyqueuosine reductase [Chloroflexota bacterium]
MLESAPAKNVNLANRIKAHARALGFSACGITTPEPPPHLTQFENWLQAGMHAGMHYLASEHARTRRADPLLILPGCQSIIVLATNYYQGEPPAAEPGPPHAKVARYAWNDDYHHTLLVRMRALHAFIEAACGEPVAQRMYADTGPLLERELAQRAGIGWIGKNTLLINPRAGSWTLLSEILLAWPLPADAPFMADRCGSCTRCIDACPTQAILPHERRIDSRRCISYLTIEERGAIAPELRPALQDWVFGCDICQDVCPWNVRFAQTTNDEAFLARNPLPEPGLQDLLLTTTAQFSETYKGSPLKRAKRSGMARNAAVALGAQRAQNAQPALATALMHDAEAGVRAHAAWALGQLADAPSRATLQAALLTEHDAVVRGEIMAAIECSRTAGANAPMA